MKYDQIQPDHVPESLVEAILSDRCVAFVGAGFTAGIAPSWPELLEELAVAGDVESEVAALIGKEAGRTPAARDFEMAGQLVKDALGSKFDEAVRTILGSLPKRRVPPDHATVSEAQKRRKDLLSIPFHSILTTNYDTWLSSDSARRSWGRWLHLRRDPWPYNYELSGDQSGPWILRQHVLKLHGDAGGGSVVLAASDYRELVHGTHRYADFLKALFATKKFLFVGTSFTDAYLNELRSSILHLLELDPDDPLGWAITPAVSDRTKDIFERTDHIHLLQYSTLGDAAHQGCSAWLEAIAQRTSPHAHLKKSVDRRRITWIDRNPRNNDYGFKLLRQAGADIRPPIHTVGDLDLARHQETDLYITHFGWRASGGSTFHDLMARLREWGPERPPVVVFCGPDNGPANRETVLRLGAYECCWEWRDLIANIERLFRPAKPAPR